MPMFLVGPEFSAHPNSPEPGKRQVLRRNSPRDPTSTLARGTETGWSELSVAEDGRGRARISSSSRPRTARSPIMHGRICARGDVPAWARRSRRSGFYTGKESRGPRGATRCTTPRSETACGFGLGGRRPARRRPARARRGGWTKAGREPREIWLAGSEVVSDRRRFGGIGSGWATPPWRRARNPDRHADGTATVSAAGPWWGSHAGGGADHRHGLGNTQQPPPPTIGPYMARHKASQIGPMQN